MKMEKLKDYTICWSVFGYGGGVALMGIQGKGVITNVNPPSRPSNHSI